MTPARRDFSRAYADGGADDFTTTVLTTTVAVGVVGYIISRFFRRGPSAAAAANAGNAAASAAGATTAANKAPTTNSGAGANSNAHMSLEERMATFAFGGWKVAIDADALVSRAAGTAEASPTLRSADNTDAYFRRLLEAGADAYVYCQVDRDHSKKKDSSAKYVGDVSDELVGQAAVLALLKPFASSGLKREQVLFCATAKGHEAFTRQIKPTILVTSRPEVATLLARHVPYIVLVGADAAASASLQSNVISVPSLGSFSS